jgi:hypothetical protein
VGYLVGRRLSGTYKYAIDFYQLSFSATNLIGNKRRYRCVEIDRNDLPEPLVFLNRDNALNIRIRAGSFSFAEVILRRRNHVPFAANRVSRT